MTLFATIVGDVAYTPGDGMPIPIPRGRVEVALADDSATLSWEDGTDVAGVTAIPRITFDEHVQAGNIVLDNS